MLAQSFMVNGSGDFRISLGQGAGKEGLGAVIHIPDFMTTGGLLPDFACRSLQNSCGEKSELHESF